MIGDIVETIELNGEKVRAIYQNIKVEKDILDLIPNGIKVLEMKDFKKHWAKYFIGFADGNKKNILKQLAPYKITFQNLFHPSAIISKSARMGQGNFFNAGSVIASGVQLGDFNFINRCASIGHNCVIGSCNRFSPSSAISSFNRIGDRNLLGSNCSTIEYIRIGDDVTVGAGGVVVKNIEEKGTYVGVPVKKLK